MARLETRAAVRALAISLVLALVAGSAFALDGAPAPARAQQVAPSDRIAAVSAFLSAINNGNVDGAAALFASNAVFIGVERVGSCTQASPCTDAAGIHQQLMQIVSVHNCFVLRSLSISGAVVTGQLETGNNAARRNGIDRLSQDFIALVPTNQIFTFWATLGDVSDPQNALLGAIAAGTAQPVNPPIPTPATPCAAVSGD